MVFVMVEENGGPSDKYSFAASDLILFIASIPLRLRHSVRKLCIHLKYAVYTTKVISKNALV